MKFKNKCSRLTSLFAVILVLVASSFCVFAVPDESDAVAVPETLAPTEPVTEAPTPAPTEPPTEPPTNPPTEPPTEAPTYAPAQPVTEAPTQAAAPAQTEPPTVATQATKATVIETDAYQLPVAPVEPDPTAPVISRGEDGDLTYGYVSWACVLVGVLAVTVVIISNKSHYYGGSGKQRYDEGDKITGQKRLLNDDYYNNRKYNSYYTKDTRS
ncbi:MAG: hypothetical protein J1E96_01570 [Ruminococcus sp.]|nr:hypothetical protein [Ruminococcus sp.]